VFEKGKVPRQKGKRPGTLKDEETGGEPVRGAREGFGGIARRPLRNLGGGRRAVVQGGAP